MSSKILVTVRCDFCGYGGEYTRPEDFIKAGDSFEAIDLCRWCATPAYQPGSRTICGRHEATIVEGGWDCICGEMFRDTGTVSVKGWPFFVPSRVRRAVPDLATATAIHHVQN